MHRKYVPTVNSVLIKEDVISEDKKKSGDGGLKGKEASNSSGGLSGEPPPPPSSPTCVCSMTLPTCMVISCICVRRNSFISLGQD